MGGKDKKKKGPKGKKARAKAKLDRQWGEAAIVDDDKTKRVGKSRLLAKQKQRNHQVIKWGDDPSASKSNTSSSFATTAGILKHKHSSKESKGGFRNTDEIHILSSDESDGENPTTLKSLLGLIKTTSSRDSRKTSTTKFSIDEPEQSDDSAEDVVSTRDETDSDQDGPMEEDETTAVDDGDGDDHETGTDGTTSGDIFTRRFGSKPLGPEEMDDPVLQRNRVQVGDGIELHIAKIVRKDTEPSDIFLDSTLAPQAFSSECDTILAANKKVLQTRWKRFHKKPLSTRESCVYPFMSRYMDMLITSGPRKSRGGLHKLYLLHVVNHILSSRSRVQRHNRELKELEEQQEKDDEGSMPNAPEDEAANDDNDDDDEEGPIDLEKERRRKLVLEKKGKEWNELFGDDVNQDDDFKLGISILPKVANSKKQATSSSVQVKLYTDFYKSDLIVASPLGLKFLLTPDENGDFDADYLSSIEICLLQRADVLMMQNWDHVGDVLRKLNMEPQKNNGTDFSRVRNYMLEGQAQRWRQLIVSTEILDPYIQSTFNKFAKSVSGSIKMREKTLPDAAALEKIYVPVKQVFQRLPTTTFDKQSDARVNYFVKTILPQILRYKQKHTLIYIPSYFDFVTLRNVLLKRELPFVMVHEYSRVTETSRARARFLQGRKPIMLYTGRSNFFYRHEIKGIRHLVFLGLPEHPQFYTDHVNLINTVQSDNEDNLETAFTSVASCLALFTQFEGHALERVVGTSNCARMLKSAKSTFMFHA